jgi:hypothetical protein
MMETTSTMQSPRVVPFADESLRAPLPALTMGDTAVSGPRQHGWPARLFIALNYLTAGALGIGAVLFTGVSLRYGLEPGWWARLVGVGVWSVLHWRLASEVSRFSRWGWYGAMAGIAAAVAANVGLGLYVPVVGEGGLVMLALNVAWIRYFWKRRADYDVDLGG